MEKLPEFIANHWVLSLIFVILLLMIVGGTLRQRLHGIKKLSNNELVRLMSDQKIVLIDTRSEADFEKGHISGAVNVPFTRLGKTIDQVLKKQKHKDEPIVIVDEMGHQAVAAGAMMNKQGFGPLFMLAGGVSAWQNDHMPLNK